MLKPGLYEQIISQKLSKELTSVKDTCKYVEKLDPAEAPQALAGYVAEAVRAALEAMPSSTEEQAAQRITLVNKVLDVLARQREDLSEKTVDNRAEKLLQIHLWPRAAFSLVHRMSPKCSQNCKKKLPALTVSICWCLL